MWVFFFKPAGWYKWHVNPPGGQHMCTRSCLYYTECLHTQTFSCMCRLDPYGGASIILLFHPSSAQCVIFFHNSSIFCGSSNRVKVAVSVSLKQWINGRNTASSNTTVVFWLVTNCCCTCHLIFTLSHLLCSQTRLSSFVDSTTNVQAHATHALVPYFPTEFLLKSLKRWRPFFVEKRIKWIHFFAFLHANTAQWYGKGTTTTFKMHKAQTMGN